MHPLVKAFVGFLLIIAGVYWYYSGFFVDLISLFKASFGLVLIFAGLLIAWVEYEDWRWIREEQRRLKNFNNPKKGSRKK